MNEMNGKESSPNQSPSLRLHPCPLHVRLQRMFHHQKMYVCLTQCTHGTGGTVSALLSVSDDVLVDALLLQIVLVVRARVHVVVRLVHVLSLLRTNDVARFPAKLLRLLREANEMLVLERVRRIGVVVLLGVLVPDARIEVLAAVAVVLLVVVDEFFEVVVEVLEPIVARVDASLVVRRSAELHVVENGCLPAVSRPELEVLLVHREILERVVVVEVVVVHLRHGGFRVFRVLVSEVVVLLVIFRVILPVPWRELAATLLVEVASVRLAARVELLEVSGEVLLSANARKLLLEIVHLAFHRARPVLREGVVRLHVAILPREVLVSRGPFRRVDRVCWLESNRRVRGVVLVRRLEAGVSLAWPLAVARRLRVRLVRGEVS